MIVRRIVTGNTNGRSVIASDGPAPRTHVFKHLPGMATSLIWGTAALPEVPFNGRDPIDRNTGCVPSGSGESRLMFVTFPPDSVTSLPGFDGVAAGGEYAAECPDIAAAFEPDAPGMHATATVDYAIILDGEIWLEVDDGHEVRLRSHDVVIQNGTRHAWRNKSSRTAKVAFVLIGARRRE
ncbi:MAG: cupin domain-containing protein [Pseudomonadota bacterium]